MQLVINKLHTCIYIRTAVSTSGFRDRPIYLGAKPIPVPDEGVGVVSHQGHVESSTEKGFRIILRILLVEGCRPRNELEYRLCPSTPYGCEVAGIIN